MIIYFDPNQSVASSHHIQKKSVKELTQSNYSVIKSLFNKTLLLRNYPPRFLYNYMVHFYSQLVFICT